MSHVMIDLESLGIGVKPVLLSLGAVRFTEDEILSEFHVGIDPASCQAHGLEITASTVLWWMKPELQEARNSIMSLELMHIALALSGFATWAGPDVEGLWGNGSAEDNIWLNSAYAALGYNQSPFDFRMNRCYRTIKRMFPDPALQPPDEAVAHDALCDAKWQAKHLQNICKAHGLKLL